MLMKRLREFFSKKPITVMILPHTHTGMKQFKIPCRLIASTLIFCSIIFVGFLWFGFEYCLMVSRTSRYESLQAENGAQKKEILEIADDINRLNSQMDSLMLFSRQLQTLMGIEASAELHNRTGGIEASEIDRFALLYKKNQKVLLNQIKSDIDQLKEDIPYQRSIHSLLSEKFQQDAALLAAIPSISPVDGGWISSGFGMRNDPFTGRRKMHHGLDIAQNRNAPVYATADGVITYAKRHGGLGKLVAIEHDFGFTTRYAHLSIILVKFNQKVKRGDIIGRVGSTGRSKGLHLHYEVLMEGVPVDPRQFILDRVDN